MINSFSPSLYSGSLLASSTISAPAALAPEGSSNDALTQACKTKDFNQVHDAIRRGARPDIQTLTWACFSGQSDIFEAVLSVEAKPDEETLNAACTVKQPDFVARVIELGAKPKHNTLSLARESGNASIISQVERICAAELPARMTSLPKSSSAAAAVNPGLPTIQMSHPGSP
jgi:hypothetical protein